MKNSSSKTRVGVAGFENTLIPKIKLFEIDAFDPILKNKTFHRQIATYQDQGVCFDVSANHYFFRNRSSIPLFDRIQMLREICDLLHAESCILKLPPTFFDVTTLEETFSPFVKQFNEVSTTALSIDLPQTVKTLRLNSRLFIPHCTDPLWVKPSRAPYWRIHGWHSERWVRRYSPEALASLAKSCVRFKPEKLIFAHSQRFSQAIEFLAQI